MAGYRVDRISEDIKREIVSLIKELKDPRVTGKLLTVVRVEVSSDASFAKVFVSDLQGIESAKEAVAGLTSATGYIRRAVGKNLHLRMTPAIKFVADDSVEYGFNLFKKLDESKSHKTETVDGENDDD
ncbi:MAG: 30S ribosome-binding factor RbfA [Clostridia bacterium]